MRRVSVYRRADSYYVQADSNATTGLWVATGDVEVLPTSTQDAELGAAVARRLEHSLRGVPHPTDFNELAAPLLKTPTTRDSPRVGYAFMPDRAVTVASTELQRIGSVVRDLLAAKA